MRQHQPTSSLTRAHDHRQHLLRVEFVWHTTMHSDCELRGRGPCAACANAVRVAHLLTLLRRLLFASRQPAETPARQSSQGEGEGEGAARSRRCIHNSRIRAFSRGAVRCLRAFVTSRNLSRLAPVWREWRTTRRSCERNSTRPLCASRGKAF